MGPKEDFNTTFGRVFGEDQRRPPPPPPSCSVSPFAPPARVTADIENFGPGFHRLPATGAFSTRTRTRCVQDIILRDQGANNNEPVMRYDAAPVARSSPTYAVTSTTHFKANNSPRQLANNSPRQLVRRILPGLEADATEETPRTGRRHGDTEVQQSPARHRSHSPGICQAPVHLMGHQLLQASPASPRAAPYTSAPSSPAPQASPASPRGCYQQRPAHHAKKRFPERPDFAGGRSIQQPGIDGGEFEASKDIGEVSVPDNLSLRPELAKKMVQQRSATAFLANECQYRTREIVTMRSKERCKNRWN